MSVSNKNLNYQNKNFVSCAKNDPSCFEHKGKNCLSNYENCGNFNLYTLSSLGNDKCEICVQTRQSEFPGMYMTSNYHSCKCEAPNVSRVANSQPNIYYRDGYGQTSMDGCNIDQNSMLRNGQIITKQGNCKQQLYERPYLTVPYMGRGVGNTCTESELITGDQTGSKPACNTLAEVTFNPNFIPMIPCLSFNVQNPKHLIPETVKAGWVRGGVPSRQIVKNIDYGQKCGQQYMI